MISKYLLGLFGCCCLYGWQGCTSPNAKVNYGNNHAVGKYFAVRGFKLYYEKYGNGEPVIMIHSNNGSIRDFEKQIPFFSKNYEVIAADSRAQGKSIDAKDSLSYEMMADDVNVLLDSLKLKSCNVIGWSDGGIIGMLLAIRNPGKVKRLIVSGANLWPDTTAVTISVHESTAKSYYRNLSLLKSTENPDEELKNRIKLLRLLVFQPHIRTIQLKKINCPALIIAGDHDIIRPKHTLLIAESIRGSCLWILPNSGHATLIYDDKQFNEIVGNFLSQPIEKAEDIYGLK